MANLSIKIGGYSQLEGLRTVSGSSFFDLIEEKNKWGEFMETVSSHHPGKFSSHIYKVMRPSAKKDVNGTLEVLTNFEAYTFLHTSRNEPLATCEKMHLFDIIRLSRIYLAEIKNPNEKQRVVTALTIMADKAEAKYNKGFMGTLRRVLSCVCNFFQNKKSITFFYKEEMPPEAKDNVPFFVGSNANFARLVAQNYSQDSLPAPSAENMITDLD